MSGTRTSVRREERSLGVLMHIPVAVEAMAGAVKVVATLVAVCVEAMDMAVCVERWRPWTHGGNNAYGSHGGHSASLEKTCAVDCDNH